MKSYIVKTKSNRRLIVTAKSKDGARKQIETGSENKCPWSGKANPIQGESVERVEPVGTFFS